METKRGMPDGKSLNWTRHYDEGQREASIKQLIKTDLKLTGKESKGKGKKGKSSLVTVLDLKEGREI